MATTLGGKVEQVVIHEDTSGRLVFGERPGLPGGRVLFFDKSPPKVQNLEGKKLIVDEQGGVFTEDGTKIAEREGETKIRFLGEESSTPK